MKVLVAILAISTSIAAGSAVYLSVNRTKLAAVPAAAPQPVAVVADAPAGARRMPTERAELVGRLSAASEVDVQATGGGSVLMPESIPVTWSKKGKH
jgi:hypothetical protein